MQRTRLFAKEFEDLILPTRRRGARRGCASCRGVGRSAEGGVARPIVARPTIARGRRAGVQ
eukprot:5746939-Lingulodinium_polyedra.AAC.1